MSKLTRIPLGLGIALIHAGWAVVPSASAEAQSAGEVRVFMPAFEGPQALGDNFSAILSLQLERTLRYWSQNPEKADVARVAWGDVGAPEFSREAAQKLAVETGSQMVLWGTVAKYGPGFVVQPTLTLPAAPELYQDTKEQWILEDGDHRLELELPSHNFTFSPILLDAKTGDHLSQTGVLRLCAEKEPCDGVALDRSKVKTVFEDGQWIYVSQAVEGSRNEEKGWVNLFEVPETSSTVVDFSSALFAYLRGDFAVADKLFTSVVKQSRGLINYDAALLAGIARARNGGDGIDALESALEMDPYSRYAAQALTMAYLSDAKDAPNEVRNKYAQRALDLLVAYENQFDAGDPWLGTAHQLVKQYQSN